MTGTVVLQHPPRPAAALEVRLASTPAETAAVLAIRQRVFADEQGLARSGVTDADDERSVHALALIDGLPVGTGRLTPPTPARPEAQVTWVATLPPFRGRGIGEAVMRLLLSVADDAGVERVLLSAQTHALDFYRRLGFVPYGDRFVVHGIEHQSMSRHRPRR